MARSLRTKTTRTAKKMACLSRTVLLHGKVVDSEAVWDAAHVKKTKTHENTSSSTTESEQKETCEHAQLIPPIAHRSMSPGHSET